MRGKVAIAVASAAAVGAGAWWLFPPVRGVVRHVVPERLAEAVGVVLPFDYGRKDGRDSAGNVVSRDPSLLDPTFARALQELFKRLRAEGLRPRFQEGYRSLKRAEFLDGKGTGISLSMHCYGLAADIIEDDGTPYVADALWEAIGRHSAGLGLEWGGRWRSRGDCPHVQAVPAVTAIQNRVRRATPEEIAQIARESLPQWAA